MHDDDDDVYEHDMKEECFQKSNEWTILQEFS